MGEKHGEYAERELRVCLESIAWKCDFYRYHSIESIQLFEEAAYKAEEVDVNDSKAIAFAKSALLTASGAKSARAFSEGKMKSEAHLIAAAQAVHSLGDIIANAAYWALGLAVDMDEKDLKAIDLSRGRRNAKVDEVAKTAMQVLWEMPEYKYLTAFVNVTKHRRLVPVSVRAELSPVQTQSGGICIQRIEYEHVCYEVKWAADFLRVDMPKVMEQTVTIGHALEVALGVET